jgi:hypothetical protein
VELQDVTADVPKDAGLRRVLWSGGELNADALIEPQDIVVIRADDRGPVSMTVPNGPDLSLATASLRFPFWVIASYGKVTVSFDRTGAESVTLCSTRTEGCNVIVAGGSISSVAQRISASALTAHVHPVPADFLTPGDPVDVSLSFMTRGQDQTGLFLDEHNRSTTVLPTGRLRVPRIAWRARLDGEECDRFTTDTNCGGVTVPGLPDERSFSRERAVFGGMEAASSEIHVWDADHPHALWRIERCLNFVPYNISGSVDQNIARECRGYGIDDRFVPREEPRYLWPRYSLVVGERWWTLVDTDGEEHRIRFVGGRSIEESVAMAVRERLGRDLGQITAFFGQAAYLTVVPEYGAPFLGQALPAQRMGRLDGLALLPGDTVHLTLRRPVFTTSDAE